jgi:hypothetical protein
MLSGAVGMIAEKSSLISASIVGIGRTVVIQMIHPTGLLLTAALSLIMNVMCSTVAQAQLKYHVIPIAPGSGEGVNDKGDVTGILAAPGGYYGQGLKVTLSFIKRG